LREVVQARRYCNTLKIFKERHIARRIVWSDVGAQRIGGLIMAFSSLSFTQRTSAREGIEVDEIRALVAKHLDVDVKYVTNEAHLRDDLGADWLNRLELLILIEDQFVGVEIMDDDADQIETVGDLIRYIEGVRVGSMTGAAPSQSYV
jgi:acyl carrier protein